MKTGDLRQVEDALRSYLHHYTLTVIAGEELQRRHADLDTAVRCLQDSVVDGCYVVGGTVVVIRDARPTVFEVALSFTT